MSTVDMSSVDIKGPLTCQVLTKIKMSSVDIFVLDEKFLTSFELFLCSIDFCQELTCFLILGVSYNASIDFCQELTCFLKLGVSQNASIDFC